MNETEQYDIFELRHIRNFLVRYMDRYKTDGLDLMIPTELSNLLIKTNHLIKHYVDTTGVRNAMGRAMAKNTKKDRE